MRDLFMGTHHSFTPPLSVFGVGGYVTYVPIPFERSLKMVVRAKLVQFIQLNYARYPATAGIRSWSPSAPPDAEASRAREVLSRAGQNISVLTAPPGAKVVTQRLTRIVQPGVPATLLDAVAPTGGRIVGIRLSPASAFAGKERATQLRVYFDGNTQPAIAGPVGDLFGYAWGKPTASSLLVGTSRDTAYMYFPMPYDRRARVVLSLDPGHAPLSVHAEFDLTSKGRQPDEGRFYALWHRENPTTPGRPFTYLHTQGRGHIVGLALQSQGIGTDGTPFFEGDERVVIDGDTTVRGTGSEDSFNGGWYDVPGRWDRARSFPLSGSLGYSNALARTGGYRLFLADAYPYTKSVDFTVEHGEDTTNSVQGDYSAVTYFYSQNPPTSSWSDLPPAQRAVRDVDRISLNPGWVAPVASFSLLNATLEKRREEDIGRYLRMVADSERTPFGPHGVDLTTTVTTAGRYRVLVQMMYGPAQGIIQLYDNDQPSGRALDTYAPARRKGELEYLTSVDLGEGENVLRFKLVGKNASATRLSFDLMRVVLERER
ncbi:MAG: glycoside hydrolase family 172 protein [Gemmatimonadaceae bacterium]